jgi:serine/threonine-protein kinase HipA
MAEIHLVGETIDALTAHRMARAGDLVQMFRGVYVARGGNADELLRAHAVRIASYLYPAAYLSSASAVLLSPTADGRLFLAGRRNQRTRLRGLDIVQTQAPPRPSLHKAIVGDSMGEFTVQVSSPEQRMLEAFRLRSEQASAITEDMRRETAERLIAEYGSAEAAADSLWKLARVNDWFREGEGAERYLRGSLRPTVPSLNRAAFSLLVAWHGKPIGRLSHDGHEWRWNPGRGRSPPLIRETIPGALPPFIESLLPEGWLAQVLRDEDERSALRHGKRYMSNISITSDTSELAALPVDVMEGRLRGFSRDGLFAGRYEGPGRGVLEESFETNLARIFASGNTPRLSGVQIKAPMNLDTHGHLRPATELAFTHILKPAGTSGFEHMPVVEWLCLEFGRLAGFEAPDTALLAMPDGMPPALLVERFDIRDNPEDRRFLALEDFCSVLGVPAGDKYKGTIERMARGLRGLSTDPSSDIATLFARALFTWLVADGDMHLKNVALFKIAVPGARAFESVRMAPLYDTLTTRVFPGLEHDHMALRLAGRDDRLRLSDFETLARTIDLQLGRAREIADQLVSALEAALEEVRLPPVVADSGALPTATAVMAIVRERCAAFASDLRGDALQVPVRGPQ